MKLLATVVSVIVVVFSACTSAGKKSDRVVLVRSDYSPAELTQLCNQEIENLSTRINRLSKAPLNGVSFETSFLEFEKIVTEFQEKLGPLTFMYSVSTDEKVKVASQECEANASKASIEVFSRRDVYNVLKAGATNSASKVLTNIDKRLVSETLRSFKLSGLELSDENLEKFKNLKKEISDLQTQFQANLNNNNDFAEMSEQEMAGVPNSVKDLFPKLPNNRYQVSTKATFYRAFMENASDSEARKKMQLVYDNREAKTNTVLLQKTINLRRQAALLVGFKDWADYKTNDKMAKTGKVAWDFLQELKTKLRKAYLQDYHQLLSFKKELDPKAVALDPWDGSYLSNQYRKKYFAIDDELVREYFPSDYVLGKMFEIYETLLNIKFVQINDAVVWHESVKLFEIHDQKTNEILAYFFTDLVPRKGKYGHAAAFPIRSGYEVNGKLIPPISSIVANLTPPTETKPSLLNLEEVDTLFHEFGHIMHMSLTRVKYASLSGANVAWDFVEAPSQMLENWVWEPQILKMISRKYNNPSEAMPAELIEKLVSSRKFNQAWMNTRQLIYGIFDLTLHRSPQELDVTETYRKIYQELTGIKPPEDTHVPANFGHLMGGYDAGYYGYLWSNVYAFDMYTRFQGKNLLSSEVGGKYRNAILEKGNSSDATVLLADFLGRKPNSDAFFRFLGIKK